MQQPVDANLLAVNGGYLFAEHCATCHGEGGKGVKPSIEYSPQSVPDLRRISSRHGGRFPERLVREIIDGRQMIESHQRRMMPRWADELQRLEGASDDAHRRANQKIDALVKYVKSIQINE